MIKLCSYFTKLILNCGLLIIGQLIFLDFASGRIQLVENEKNSTVNTFLNVVQSKLPPIMIKVLNRYKILISFDIISAAKHQLCIFPNEIADSELNKDLERKNNEILQNNYMLHSIYGKSDGCNNNTKECHIHLNQEFLEIIEKNDKSEVYNCGHKTRQKVVEATLIHELSHIFDELGRSIINPKRDQKIETICDGGYYPNLEFPQQEICKLLSNHYAISDRIDFMNLSGWDKNIFKKDDFLNENFLRSPDRYEYTNPEENFAVNMEYFILDPEYKCRRPLYYFYLSNIFDFYPLSFCNINYEIIISGTSEKVLLLPDNLEQVDYLLIDDGESSESKFGHSSFLMTFKNNNKTEKYVLTYLAGTSNPSIWGGLTGRYRSTMQIQKFTDFISSYRWIENRDIFIYPLKMTSTQKNRFLLKTLDVYWNYSSSYYFLTNNCAVQSFKHLQSVFLNSEWQVISDKIISPKGLLSILVETQKTDKNQVRQIFSANYFLKKIWDSLKDMDSILQDLKKYSNLDNYYEDNNQKQKLMIISNMINNQTKKILKRKILNSFIQLENNKLINQKQLINTKIITYLNKEIENTVKLPHSSPIDDLKLKLNHIVKYMSPTYYTKSGYGIPTRNEIISSLEIEKRISLYRQLMSTVLSQITKNKIIDDNVMNSIESSLKVIQHLDEFNHVN